MRVGHENNVAIPVKGWSLRFEQRFEDCTQIDLKNLAESCFVNTTAKQYSLAVDFRKKFRGLKRKCGRKLWAELKLQAVKIPADF